MRPSPITPSVFPVSCVPTNLFRSHFPAFIATSAVGICRASEVIKAIVCSAAETVFPPGVFITTMPLRVAAATSMLSTPTPARAMARNRPGCSRYSAETFGAERTMAASAPRRATLRSSPVKPGRLSTSMPARVSSSIPADSSLSAIKTRGIGGPKRGNGHSIYRWGNDRMANFTVVFLRDADFRLPRRVSPSSRPMLSASVSSVETSPL